MSDITLPGGPNRAPSPPPGLDLTGSPRRRRKEDAIRLVFLATGIVSVVISLGIVYALAEGAIDFLTKAEMASLWTDGWFPRRGDFDIKTLVVGTFLVAGVAMVFAAPLGLGAAIYLSEYAPPRVRKLLKPVLEVLAGIPSVVLGFFAISFITPSVLQAIKSDIAFFNMLAAGIGVGILTIPIVASVTEDALRAVPMSLREASYGLGSRKMTTTVKVVLPAAISGIVAALIIGVSRAIGETMVVAVASGATGGSLFTLDLFGSGQTLTAAMASLGAGTDQVVGDNAASQSLYFLGLLLFLMTLALNFLGEALVRRVRQDY